MNEDGTLEFKVTQSSSDAQVLFYIKKNLGFGSVAKQDKVNNTHHYRVRDEKFLLKIIEIFNGSIVLDKVNARFEEFVEAFNLRYNKKIVIKPKNRRIYLEDG